MKTTTTPSYFNDDGSGVTKLLQRFNIQSTKEVEIFQNLVKTGESKILYKDALQVTGLKNNPQFFMSAMEKFEECQIAIFRHDSYSNTSEDKDYIRLCDESSLVFYAEYVTEMITTLKKGTNIVLPLVSEIEKKGVKIPKDFIKAYDADFMKSLNESSFDMSETLLIISIQVKNDQFLFTPPTFAFICEMCIQRIQSIIMTQSGVIHTFARVFDLTLSDMRLKVESNDLLTWNTLSDTVYSKIDSLRGQQDFKAYPELPVLFTVLHSLLKTKILQIESEYNFNESCANFSKIIIKKMLENPGGMVKQQFQAILQETAQDLSLTDVDKYIEKFSSDSIIQASDFNGENILPIVDLDKFYIHKDDLKHVISEHYFLLENKLAEYYKKLLKKYLSGTLSPKQIVFFDQEILEASVHQKVMEFDELYYKILKQPIILASVIIESSKSAKNDNKNDDDFLKRSSHSNRLSLFFNIQTQRLLKWYIIFNLNIPKLGEQAYQQLGVFRKLLLLFTGRYQSLRTRLKRISVTPSVSEVERRATNKQKK